MCEQVVSEKVFMTCVEMGEARLCERGAYERVACERAVGVSCV
jgi:hypothetical protein